MGPDTVRVWVEAVCQLQDDEAANLAVVSLYKRQAHRPKIAELVEAYDAERRSLALEAQERMTNALPEADNPGFYSIEAQRRWNNAHRMGGTPDHPLTVPDGEIDAAEAKAKAEWLASGSSSQERRAVAAQRVRDAIDRLVEAAQPVVEA